MSTCRLIRGLTVPAAFVLSGCNTVLMLIIVVPVIALTVIFAWRYRQSNNAAIYTPDWDHSTQLELVIWAAPLLIIIALDWKWLFIYPEQGIAVVNEVAAPVDVPINFRITASSVMNSFFVPALAGQIYAMPGMQTQLNAVINQEGDYEGFSANYSGAGFSGMHFKFRGVSQGEFAQWVQAAKGAGQQLSKDGYQQLARPSEREPVRRYAAVDASLYDAILNQ